MDFFEAVNKRRAVRKFTQGPVPDAVVEKAIDAALLAPSSSNIQHWEFYWVKDSEKKKLLVEACFSQGAAATAAHLIVAVSRIDTWRRHRDLILGELTKTKVPEAVLTYYKKVVPLSYVQGPFGLLGLLKRPLFALIGLFRPSPRGPAFRSDLFEVATKSTALACENFMLAVSAQGFDSCPMEGCDEVRVKRILHLGGKAHVVMVIGVGQADPLGIFGERLRVPRDWVVHHI